MANDSKLQLRVASPCQASWKGMVGNDRARFCGDCRQNVYNLSAMTDAEAQALVTQHEGRLCVRFYQRPDGTVLTLDCSVAKRRSFLHKGAGAAAVLAATVAGVSGIAGCADDDFESAEEGEPVVQPLMGSIAEDPHGGTEELDLPEPTDRIGKPVLEEFMGEMVAPEPHP